MPLDPPRKLVAPWAIQDFSAKDNFSIEPRLFLVTVSGYKKMLFS